MKRKTISLTSILRDVLIVHICLAAIYAVLVVVMAWQGRLEGGDFTAFYTGWTIVRNGDGPRLYDWDLQARYQQQILHGRVFNGGLLPYVNPPHATLPFVPLASVSRTTALLLWMLLQVALLFWALRLLHSVAASWTATERHMLLTAVLAFRPLYLTFVLGTFSLLMLVCFLQFYLALKRTHDTRAALWLVAGTVKMQLMLLPGVLLLAGHRWRALGAALLAGGAAGLLSAAVLGWQTWIGYFQMLRTVNGIFGRNGIWPEGMYNLKGTLTLLLGNENGPLINQLATLGLLVGALLALLIWHGSWQPESPRFELKMALTLLLGLFFGPYVNQHDGLLLVMPALLFYDYLRRREIPRRLYAAFVLSCPFLFLVGEGLVGNRLGIRLPVVAMIVLFGWMCRAFVAERNVEMAPRLQTS
ncbi:MAG TPA: glycosyltransferase family 87 protein [Herpetosiphonaceae bacterium]|nr:glycosyltransferase family 87 protein [Herpetosiphonaceae bacterium]